MHSQQAFKSPRQQTQTKMKTSYITFAITHNRPDEGKLAQMAANHIYSMEKVSHCDVVEVPTAPEMTEAAWVELHRLREAVKGPAGFETWMDFAESVRQDLAATLVVEESAPTAQAPGDASSQ
jgi:hypothetical protein